MTYHLDQVTRNVETVMTGKLLLGLCNDVSSTAQLYSVKWEDVYK